ncbi:MAG: cation-translocating P-type ATPase [Pseudobdellovibrio sp.]
MKKSHSNDCNHDHNIKNKESLRTNGSDIVTKFKVLNMDCADEISAIEKALNIDGVLEVQTNLISSTIQIMHTNKISRAELKNRIETTVARIIENEDSVVHVQQNIRVKIVVAAGILLLIGLVFELLKFSDLVSKILLAASIFVAGSLVFPKAIKSLKRISLDMNVLMSLATVGAIYIGEYSEAAAVVFLFALSELLESLSVQKARRAIQGLMKVAPNKALKIIKEGQTETVNVETILVSELIRVRPGENIPLDGFIVAGNSFINQASLTGESKQVQKMVGDPVFAGTINRTGCLDIRVCKKFNETKIAQVVHLIEQAQSQRAISQKFIDQFAKIYTPAVLLIAIATFLVPVVFYSADAYLWFYKALVLLVIACPCALVLSTPVSIVSSLTALARRGILVKGGMVLEVLGKIKALAVDKTGTITTGQFAVKKVFSLSDYTENNILQLAASMEVYSKHPFAQAVIKYAEEKNISLKKVINFVDYPGRGIEANIDGQSFVLGNHHYVHELSICTPELEKYLNELQSQTTSVAVVCIKPSDNQKGQALGVLELGDELRHDIVKSLNQIRHAGVRQITMLSGDNQKAVSEVGRQVGLDQSIGDLLPEDKVQAIGKLNAKYKVVAMIGDGINDAPAMAKSAVGIAMGFIGSDIAIETADVVLMTDDISLVAVAIKKGQRTLNIIKFNIAFALGIKIIFFVLTFFGHSNLWLAVAADTGAALLVIMNSLRLL